MSDPDIQETNVHDLSLGVIHALSMVDVKALSYVQLRRLNAALIHASEQVAIEISKRADTDNSGDTIRASSPRFTPPR